MEEYEYDVIIYGTGLINCLIGSILTKNNIKILHIDKYSDYGNQFRSLNFKQFLLHNYSVTVTGPPNSTTNDSTVIPGNKDITSNNTTSTKDITTTTGPSTVTEENSNTKIAAPKPLGTNSNNTTNNEIAVVTKTGESSTFSNTEENLNEIAAVTNFGESSTFSTTEENLNEIAAVTKTGESDTFKGKGANFTATECTITKETPLGAVGTGCCGPDPVTEDLSKKILPYKKLNNEERKKILKEILLENNKYNIDIYPKFFIKNSFFSKFLIETNLHNNLQFCTNHNNNIFFISNSSVTVTGPTENTEEPNNITEENSNTQIAAKGSTGIKDTEDTGTIGASTVTEEKNLNTIAVVTKSGESDTFSTSKDTEGEGVGEELPFGEAVGASTVMEELVYDKNSIFRCKYLNLIEKRLLYKFFNHISSVTVTGTTESTTPGKGANDTFTTSGKGANSTLMECTTTNNTIEEKNSNEIAAVTKIGESSTNSEGVNTGVTSGVNTKDIKGSEGTGAVGASTVTGDWNEYLKKNNLNKKLIKIINNCILINNKNNINENIKEIKNYLKIFEKDKNFLIYFLYGISNLIQNISRLSSIYNCHFMLNQFIYSITVSSTTATNGPEVTTDNLSTSTEDTEDIPGKGANSMGMECTSEKITNEIAAVTKTRESTNNSKDTNTKVTMGTNETPFGVGGTGSRDTDPVTEKRIEIILDDYKIYTKYIISEYDITNNITPVTVSVPSDSNPPPKGANSTGMECTPGKRANSMGMDCTTTNSTKDTNTKETPFRAVGVTEETGAVGASTVTEEEKIIIVYIISNKKLLNDFNLCIILSDDDSSVTVTGPPTSTVVPGTTGANSTTGSESDTTGPKDTKDIRYSSFGEENSTTQFAAPGKGDTEGVGESSTVGPSTVMENIYIIQLNKETYNSPENKYIIYFITKYKENILNKILKLYNNLGNDLNTILYYTFNLFNIFNYIHIFSTNTVLAPMATTVVPDTNNTTTGKGANFTATECTNKDTKESSFGGGTKDIGAVELDTVTEINGIKIYKYKYKNNIILLSNELNISYYISQIFLSIYYSNTVLGPTNSTTNSTLTTTNTKDISTIGPSTVTEGKGANFMPMECTAGKGANGTNTEETSNINNIKETPLGVKGGTFGVKEDTFGVKGGTFGVKEGRFGAGDVGVGCRDTDPVTEEKIIENYLKYKNIDEENIDINCEFLNDLINKFIF